MEKMVLAGFAVLLVSVPSWSQVVQPSPADLAALDQRVATYLQENKIPGGLVAVASKGRILHIKPYGLAHVELNVPVNENSVFEIGSISKQFTAAAALLLMEEKKLDLDARIHTYLPHLPGEWLGVTVRHLLNHTSGIPDYEEIRSYDVYQFRLTPDAIIKIAQSRPVDFAPGQGWYYSNTGYYLLSMIIERIAGQPLGKVLKTRIFEPLGMTQTRMADPEAIIPHRVAGYWIDKTGTLINRNPTETSSTLGAGGLVSTAGDLAKWDAALYGDSFLSTASKTLWWSKTPLPNGKKKSYGFGWELYPYRGLKSLSHTGQVAGFLSSFDRFPEQEVAFILFLNLYDVSTEIKYPVFHTFMPSLGPIPK